MMMNKFEFKAGTSRDDKILGLLLPTIIGLSTLTAYLIIFYLEKKITPKNSSLTLRYLVFIIALSLMYFLIKNIQKNTTNDFVVYLDNLSIKILKNETEIMSGEIIYCKIKSSNDKLVHIDITTEEDKITLIARPKVYTTITGNTSYNPCGTGTVSDMETLLTLGRTIQINIKNIRGD